MSTVFSRLLNQKTGTSGNKIGMIKLSETELVSGRQLNVLKENGTIMDTMLLPKKEQNADSNVTALMAKIIEFIQEKVKL